MNVIFSRPVAGTTSLIGWKRMAHDTLRAAGELLKNEEVESLHPTPEGLYFVTKLVEKPEQ